MNLGELIFLIVGAAILFAVGYHVGKGGRL